MIEIRSFDPRWQSDLASLWEAALPLEPITDRRFCTQVLLDRNFDPDGLQLAFHGADLVGAVGTTVAYEATSVPREEPTGWIRFLLVSPSARGAGVGTRLLSAALDRLTAQGVQRIRFSDNLPTYLTPGLNRARYPVADAMLRDRGFVSVARAQSMARPVAEYLTTPTLMQKRDGLQAAGYQFRSPALPELLPLVQLASHTFSDDWADLIRGVIYHHDPFGQIVVAIDPAGSVVGWAMFGSYPDTLSRFGPFGVSQTERGKGVGAVLLDSTLTAMRRAGLDEAWFMWVEPDSPAERLYLRAGFEVRERFDILELEIRPRST